MNKSKDSVLKRISEKRDPRKTAKVKTHMLLAAKIADALKAKGWTKSEFAKRMDQTPSTVTKWLSGTHNFTVDTLSDIEFTLGIELLNVREEQKKIEVVQVFRESLSGLIVNLNRFQAAAMEAKDAANFKLTLN